MQKKVAIIGAGPAGLTAAYLLAKENQQVVVFEKTLNMLVEFQGQKPIKATVLILVVIVSFLNQKK